MSFVLGETSHSEQAVKRAFKFVTMHKSEFTDAQGQIAIAVRLALVHHNSARAVHGFYAIDFIVDDCGIHIVLVVIPVSAGFPQMAVHNHRR